MENTIEQKDKFTNASEIVNAIKLALSIDETYTSNVYFAKQMVMNEGLYLQHLPKFQDDESVVFLAVSQDGSSLSYRSKRLQQNKKIALERVSNNGIIYHMLDQELKKDIDITKRAVRRFGEMYRYIPEELKKNDEIIKDSIKNYPFVINDVPEDMRNNYAELFSDSIHSYEENLKQKEGYSKYKPKSRSLAQDNPEGDKIINSINQSKEVVNPHTVKKSKFDRE